SRPRPCRRPLVAGPGRGPGPGAAAQRPAPPHGPDPQAQADLKNLAAAGIERPKAADGTPVAIPNTADTGYFGEQAGAGMGQVGMAPCLAVERQKHHEAPVAPDPTATAAEASVKQKMQQKLRSATGQAPYAARKHIVEPVFGQIKSVRG